MEKEIGYEPKPTEEPERVPNNRHQRRKEAALARKEKETEI